MRAGEDGEDGEAIGETPEGRRPEEAWEAGRDKLKSPAPPQWAAGFPHWHFFSGFHFLLIVVKNK